MSRHEDFYPWQGQRQDVTVGDHHFGLPLVYHDNDMFASLHTASYEAVTAALPSEAIRPVRWLDGRALLGIYVFRYNAVTWTRSDGSTGTLVPYGEIGIVAVVTTEPAPRVPPLLQGKQAGFVLHLPVTTKEARDGGRQLWGFPKFVADMDYQEAPDTRQVRLSESGQTIMALTVRPGGPVLTDRRPLTAYTVLDGQLFETVVPALGHVQARIGARSGELQFGEHQIADGLRKLQVSPAPLAVFNYFDHRSILPAGRPVGPARPHGAYQGQDRPFGRFTVTYPGSPPLDQYATNRTATPVPIPVS